MFPYASLPSHIRMLQSPPSNAGASWAKIRIKLPCVSYTLLVTQPFWAGGSLFSENCTAGSDPEPGRVPAWRPAHRAQPHGPKGQGTIPFREVAVGGINPNVARTRFVVAVPLPTPLHSILP